MSIYKNRKRTEALTHRRSYSVISRLSEVGPYYDEGWNYVSSKGRRSRKRKRILAYQARKYRTWKHHRAHQWIC